MVWVLVVLVIKLGGCSGVGGGGACGGCSGVGGGGAYDKVGGM